MPYKIPLRPNGNSVAFSANQPFNLPLDLVPFTMTELILEVSLNVTTGTTPGDYSDGWDRVIQQLNLTRGGVSYFGFLDLRAAYHMSRMQLQQYAPKRPKAIAASQSNVTVKYLYRFHFGTNPIVVDPRTNAHGVNPFDLTGGIPPTGKADLVLSGVWGPAAAVGSGYTINSGSITPYFVGVTNLPNEAASVAMPLAFPSWEMKDGANDVANLSSAYASKVDFPIGDYLQAALIMTTQGANAPRSDGVLSNLRIWDAEGGREIWTAADWKVAELLTQDVCNGWPPSDDGVTLNTPAVGQVSDPGLVWIDFTEIASQPDPDHGLSLGGVQKSVLQWQFGVANATSAGLKFLYVKYVKNAAHPAQIVPALHPEKQKTALALAAVGR